LRVAAPHPDRTLGERVEPGRESDSLPDSLGERIRESPRENQGENQCLSRIRERIISAEQRIRHPLRSWHGYVDEINPLSSKYGTYKTVKARF